MKPRRVLIFSLSYYPRFVGGAEVAVKEVTDRLPPGEFEFDMVTLGGGEIGASMLGNVNVHKVKGAMNSTGKLLFPFRAYRMALRMQKEKGYDAVWAIMASYAGYAAFLFKKKHPGIPLLLSLQEGDHFGRRQGVLKPFFQKIFTAADRIQTISRFLADWAASMGAKCPIEVVPNGVDLERFSKPVSADKISRLRAEAGFSADDVVLVTASRLVYKNAVDDIIRALSFLPAVKAMILGTGRDEKALRELAKASGADKRVYFAGFVPHSELPAYLQASDIFIRPSRSEGLGNSFLEAMAAGIPVIATAVGGIPDFLTDGETGLFCEVGNPRSIAQKVEKLVKDRESRHYIVRQARTLVEERYQWAGIAEKMRKILLGA